MSELETKAVDLLDKLENLATQYTPEVMDAATSAVTVTAIGHVISNVVGILFAVGLAFAVKYWFKFFMNLKKEGGSYNDWGMGAWIGAIVGGVVAIITFMVSFICMLDIWMWTAIFNPELALAHKILGL